MTWKIVNNSDSGDADHHGGDSTDKISQAFSGLDVDDIDINLDFKFRDGKAQLANPLNTAKYKIRTSAITSDKDITIPLLTAPDTWTFNDFPATIKNKTFDSSNNITAATGAGTKFDYSYFIYNDAGTFKAKNGSTGVVDYSNANLHSVLNSIFTAMSSVSYTDICIGPGIHSITDQVVASSKSNWRLRGVGRGITVLNRSSGFPNTDLFFITGTLDATVNYSLAANCNKQTAIATVTAGQSANFTIGDRVKLVSTQVFDGTDQEGEYNRIININTGTGELFLESYTAADYLTADSAKIIKMNPAKNITFKDFSVTSAQVVSTQPTYKAIFLVRKAVNVLIENVRVFDEASRSFQLLDCVGFTVDNCSFENKLLVGDGGTDTINYDIEAGGGTCNGVVSNNRALWGGRHFFTTVGGSGGTGIDNHGVPRNIVVCNNTVHGTGPEAAFDTHGTAEGILFIGNTVRGDRVATNSLLSGWFAGWNGFQIRGRKNAVIGNIIFNSYQRAIQIDGDDTTVSDNTIIGVIASSSSAIGGANARKRAIIENNRIYDAKIGINLPSGFDEAIINNNKIFNGTNEAIKITDCASPIISNNVTRDNNRGLLLAGSTNNCRIINNDFSDNTNQPILVGGSNYNFGNTGIDNIITVASDKIITQYRPIAGVDQENSIAFAQNNASSARKTAGRLAFVLDDDTAGSEDGRMYLTLIKAGTEDYTYEFGNTEFVANDIACSNITIDDTKNIVLGTGTGTKIGTSTTQKLGFFNKTPIVQKAANADTCGGTLGQVETEVNELKQLLRDYGLLA